MNQIGVNPEYILVRLEDVRDFIIQHAISIDENRGDERAHFIDAVPTADFVEWYEKQSPTRTFYHYPDACGCRTRDCQGHPDDLKRLVAEREFHRQNGDEVDPQ